MDTNSTSPDLDFRRFFELRDPVAKSALRLEMTDDSATTLELWELVRQRQRPVQAIQLHGFMGRSLADFLWCTPVQLICVSERVLDLLRNHNLTGWGTYSVEILDRAGNSVPGYWGLSIYANAGYMDFKQSRVVTLPPPRPEGKATQAHIGFTFDQSSWDGSDIFWVGNAIVVVERVHKLFKSNRVTNVRLTPILEVEMLASLVAMIERKQKNEQ